MEKQARTSRHPEEGYEDGEGSEGGVCERRLRSLGLYGPEEAEGSPPVGLPSSRPAAPHREGQRQSLLLGDSDTARRNGTELPGEAGKRLPPIGLGTAQLPGP